MTRIKNKEPPTGKFFYIKFELSQSVTLSLSNLPFGLK